MSVSRRENLRRIAGLAWPVFVGQLAVVGFSTVDTVLVARASPLDLAALSVGSAAYITVFIGLMGVVLAIGPIVGQLFGAGQRAQAGRQLHQAVWIALGLAALGALLVQAYRGFNNAISRPKAVMALQVGGFALKVPLSALLVFGWPAVGLPALGVLGCGIATAIVMWLQAAVAWQILKRDPFYAPFELRGHGLDAPDRRAIGAQLRLGVPMGLSILIEVSGFSLMAVFIARLGVTAAAGHQIAANLAAILFMMPLALASATMTLVAQRIGAQDPLDARRLGWHGLQLGLALSAVMALGLALLREPMARLYTGDAAVIAVAVPLLAWVAAFHVADAVQAIASFVLRACKVATLPMLIYAGSLWGLGLGGGWLIVFGRPEAMPEAWRGPLGYWIAAAAGLWAAAAGLAWLMRRTLRRLVRRPAEGAG